MQPKTLVAILISIGIIFSWPLVEKKMFPGVYKARYAKQKQTEKAEKPATKNVFSEMATPAPQDPPVLVDSPISPLQSNQDEQLFALENKELKVTLSSYAGAVKSIEAVQHKTSEGQNEAIIMERASGYYFVLQDPAVAGYEGFEVQSASNREVVFKRALADNVWLTKAYTLGENYLIDVTISIENKSAKPFVLQDGYELFVSEGVGAATNDRMAKRYKGVYSLKDEHADIHKIKKVKERELIYGDQEWIGQTCKYYALIVQPQNGIGITYVKPGEEGPQLSLRTEKAVIEPKQSLQDGYTVYAGPREIAMLKQASPTFAKIVEFGWFNWIGLLLLKLLNFFYHLTSNYGVAIILLTAVVKLLLFPLSQKSFKSMKEMQKIQPMVQKIREKHKKDPQKMQMEMMKLYKEHGVNPLGGCLPLVLQMPVFFALFGVLQSAFELRDAHFLWWIQDLSQKDPTYVLPILMGITMVVQQKLSPSAMDPQQKKMMMLMPVVFTVLFVNFPSGLVLYWLVNNVLSIVHQKLVA